MASHLTQEPNYELACKWWNDIPTIWTPLGWRDHMFRFNVLWNGTVLAQPNCNRRTEKWEGQGLMLGIAPGVSNDFNDYYHDYLYQDNQITRQGWCEDAAPVLWTEWTQDGLLIRTYAFAHVTGAPEELKTGLEPLFLWMRFEVHALCPAMPLENDAYVHLLLHAPHYHPSMGIRGHKWRFQNSPYPRELKPDAPQYSTRRGVKILEKNKNVRLAIAPGARDISMNWGSPAEFGASARPAGYRLTVKMPARKGAAVDLLLPMLPVKPECLDRELALGRATALKETRAFWKKIISNCVTFQIPEPEINNTLLHSIRFSNLLSERNHETGKLCKINGSWVYAELWTTPMAMDLIMLMDTFGQHATVERYLDILLEEQGTVKPPGAAFSIHPGYFSTPARYKSIDWLSDNGAVLWVLCEHALLTGNQKFYAKALPAILRSCEWIRDGRALRGHGGYEGVLPPAVATDNWSRIQAIWSIGWNYLGLTSAIRLLRLNKHPMARALEKEAADYRRVFQAALRNKCKQMGQWTDARGKKRRFVPTALAGEGKGDSRMAFYLDTGPLFLVFTGLLPATDPLMRDTLAWFRDGPQRDFHRFDSNCWQLPMLNYEMSSCEPCYSWNVFHSWQLGDKTKFLEGMYSLFAGSLSRQTYTSCETRGGITGTVFSAPLALYLARLAVLDDRLKANELHLLRFMPQAWLKPGAVCNLKNIPTYYGTVTLYTAMTADGKSLRIDYQPKFRAGLTPTRVTLHLPQMRRITNIYLNGKILPKKNKTWQLT